MFDELAAKEESEREARLKREMDLEIQAGVLMREWRKVMTELADLENEIKYLVNELGASVEFGGVRATYVKPSDVLDYMSAAEGWMNEREIAHRNGEITVDELTTARATYYDACAGNTKQSKTVAWAKVCADLGIPKSDAPVAESKPAAVRIKKVER